MKKYNEQQKKCFSYNLTRIIANKVGCSYDHVYNVLQKKSGSIQQTTLYIKITKAADKILATIEKM